MLRALHEFLCDESGTSATDYGLMVALVAAAAFSAFAALGEDFPNFLSEVGCMIANGSGCGPSDR